MTGNAWGSMVPMGLAQNATRLTFTTISLGLQAWDRTKGVREFAVRRADEALQIAAHTPLGRLLPQLHLDDGADEEAARIATAARSSFAAEPAGEPAAPEPAPEPAAPEPIETPTTTPEAELELPASGHDLPIPDFDTIGLGSLRARLRSLDLDQLVVLREWELAHAHRLPVLTSLDNRIAKLGAATYPS